MGRRLVWALALACALAAIGSAPQGRTSAGPQAVVSPAVYHVLARGIRPRVVVALRQRVAGRRLAAAHALVAAVQRRVLARAGHGLSLGRRYRSIPAFSGRVDRAALRRLASSPDVAAVSLDRRVHADVAPASLALIKADQAQAAGFTGAGVTVAILDSGVDTDHPELADSIVGQACFVSVVENGGAGCPGGTSTAFGPGAAEDDEGHGTAVSGVITGNGVDAHAPGVAPDAKIVAVKVLPQNGSGYSSDILAGLDWVMSDNPSVKLVNLSLGSDTLYDSTCDTADASTRADASAIDALRQRGVLTFAASGNDSSSTSMEEPACVSAAVGVGAVYASSYGSVSWKAGCSDASTAADQVVCFSDASPRLDLLAPGAVIDDVPARGGGYDEFDGTSAATPYAVGVAAMLLQKRPDLTPDLTVKALKAGLKVTDPRNGLQVPRVDALAALKYVDGPSSQPGPTYLPDDDVTYAEPTGDASSGPDLGNVGVKSSRGILTFTVRTANRSSLAAGEAIDVRIDRDANASTGHGGFDDDLAFGKDGVNLERWSGSVWTPIRTLRYAAGAAGTFAVAVSQEELGITGNFRFQVAATADVAPGSGTWMFPAFPVTVTRSGSGAGTVTGDQIDCGNVCSAPFGRGASVSLTAAPAQGSAFAGWSGACTGTGRCALAVSSPLTVQARFERLRRLAVSLRGAGKGVVVSAPDGIDCGSRCDAEYASGTRVTLSANAARGSRFTRWGGACAGRGPCTVDLRSAASVTASFADVAAPTAHALASAGKRGARARLRFRLSDNSGRAGAVITVLLGTRTIKTLHRKVGPVQGVADVPWRVPRGSARSLRFCVKPVDGSRNAGKRSCAVLKVR
jgi:subtilisin family serine protease